jgi:hypothetical protein
MQKQEALDEKLAAAVTIDRIITDEFNKSLSDVYLSNLDQAQLLDIVLMKLRSEIDHMDSFVQFSPAIREEVKRDFFSKVAKPTKRHHKTAIYVPASRTRQ